MRSVTRAPMASGLTTVASANGAALVDWTVKRRTRDDVRVRLARPGGGACEGEGDREEDEEDEEEEEGEELDEKAREERQKKREEKEKEKEEREREEKSEEGKWLDESMRGLTPPFASPVTYKLRAKGKRRWCIGGGACRAWHEDMEW